MRPEGVEVVEDRSAADTEDVARDEEVFSSLFKGWEDGGGDCSERVEIEIGIGDFAGVGFHGGVGAGAGVFLDDRTSLIAEYEVGGAVVPRTLDLGTLTLPTRRGFLVTLWRFNK
jgi:hypothetical protein